jgi:hypothetical protein
MRLSLEEKRNQQRQYLKQWRKTEAGRKSTTTSNWRQRGLKGDIDKIYKIWKETEYCDLCKIELDTDGGSRKCMDHCHKTGKFRNIVCNRCNVGQLDRSRRADNTSGHIGVSWSKWNNRWEYRKTYKGKIYMRCSKVKSEVLAYKFAILLLIKHKSKIISDKCK